MDAAEHITTHPISKQDPNLSFSFSRAVSFSQQDG